MLGSKYVTNQSMHEFKYVTNQKCLLATKNFWSTQKALSKNLICDGKIKPLQIFGEMWNICDQQKKLSQLYVITVTNTNILEGNFPSILFAKDN